VYVEVMDENLKFVLTITAGAVGGAFIAGIFALVGAWVANKREHRQWLRNERLKAYETYFVETRPWTVERWTSSEIDWSKEAQSAKLKLQLVAPKDVLVASYQLVQQIVDYRAVFERGRDKAQEQGKLAIMDEEFLLQHIHVIEDRTADLGRAMRRSLKLSRRESAQWVDLMQQIPPDSDEEYRATRKQPSTHRTPVAAE
jgi:hypothetical protein